MSLGKKQFEKAYNRASNKSEVKEDYVDYYDLYGYYEWAETHYDNDHETSMRDIATGRLLTILTKLRIRGAKDISDGWCW